MAESLLYEDFQHQGLLFDSMKCMYDEQILVDVTILVQDERFHCHRVVLAACSEYFKAMFTCDLREKGQSEIRLHDLDAKSVRMLTMYAYTGEILITRTTVQSILSTASLLRIGPVQKACAEFLSRQLCVSNCVGIYCFAHAHNCNELALKAKEHTEKNFTQVYHEEEFLALSSDQLAGIISSNELNVDREETVFDAVMCWINHKPEIRLQHLDMLLGHVRFQLLSKEYMQNHIIANKLISDEQLLTDITRIKVNDDDMSKLLRSGMIHPESCIVSIGSSQQRQTAANCYNPLQRYAYQLADFPCTLETPACIVTKDNDIFVAGGVRTFNSIADVTYFDNVLSEDFDDEDKVVCKDVFRYDNDHDSWQRCASMLFPKSNFSLVEVAGKIYCFGGVTATRHPTEMIESYDRATNKWCYVGMMQTTLVDLATVAYEDFVYLLGGRTGIGSHNGVTRFDPHTHQWHTLAGMPTPRFNFGACLCGNDIYVAGGQIYSQTSRTIKREALDSVEIYDIRANTWRQGPRLPQRIYNVTMFYIDGCIYACGTAEQQCTMYMVKRYNVLCRLDCSTNRWDELEYGISCEQHCACVCAKIHTRKLKRIHHNDE